MSFRARLLTAFAVVVLVPLVVFGLGIRREMSRRVAGEYQRRVASLGAVIRADIEREGDRIAARLAALRETLAGDNDFRAAVVSGARDARTRVLDYAGTAMRLAGLDFLQIQDDDRRIVSSGHFRNEYDRVGPFVPAAGPVLVRAATAETTFLALVARDSLLVAGRRFALLGGVAVDSQFLARLARGGELVARVALPGDTVGADSLVEQVSLRYVDALEGPALPVPPAGRASIVVLRTQDVVAALRRNVNLWFGAAVLVAAVAALLLAGWLAARISRPLSALAQQTVTIDLERLDVAFASERRDEIGTLTRMLGAMLERLRAGAGRLREMERRAAFGDLARQVNHDVKNGLAPLRNVFRHLLQVARDEPGKLPHVFAERQATVESSIAYLETLAANYARLSPQAERKPTDVNAVIRDVVKGGPARLELADGLPPVSADALVLRRVLENLLGNAVDSLEGRPGTVTVATSRGNGVVRIAVQDTGKGMTKQELDRAFDDFYTTKPGGTGLGLSIVRRLVLDSNGALKVETAPGKGSTFVVELPVMLG